MMCCGKDTPVAITGNGTRMAKMPDGTTVEVTSGADEARKRDEIFAKIREKEKRSWSAAKS
jgi:hypothetical protein